MSVKDVIRAPARRSAGSGGAGTGTRLSLRAACNTAVRRFVGIPWIQVHPRDLDRLELSILRRSFAVLRQLLRAGSPTRQRRGAWPSRFRPPPRTPLRRRSPPDARFFAETSLHASTTNAFWDFFQHRGGVRGHSASGLASVQTRRLPGGQIFQREVMQQWPDGSVHTLEPPRRGPVALYANQQQHLPRNRPCPGQLARRRRTDPAYATKIVQFMQTQAPEYLRWEPVNFGTTWTAQ